MSVPNEMQARLQAFITRYAHTLDDAQWDDWPNFFTETGHYRIVTRENHETGLPLGLMYCDSKGMMQDRMLALQTANVYEPHTYCHLLSQPELKQQDGSWTGRTNFSVVRTMQSGEMAIFAAGKYLDQFEISDDQVLLSDRTVVLESRRVDILLVAPL